MQQHTFLAGKPYHQVFETLLIPLASEGGGVAFASISLHPLPALPSPGSLHRSIF